MKISDFQKVRDLSYNQAIRSGVYAHIFSNSVYVGQGKNLLSRYGTHIMNLTRGDRNTHKYLKETLKDIDDNEMLNGFINTYVLEFCDDLYTAEVEWIRRFYEDGYHILNRVRNSNQANVPYFFCSLCKQYKDKKHRLKGNRRFYCLECHNLKSKDYREEHPEKARLSNRKYYWNNLEEQRLRGRIKSPIYYRENRESILAKKRVSV